MPKSNEDKNIEAISKLADTLKPYNDNFESIMKSISSNKNIKAINKLLEVLTQNRATVQELTNQLEISRQALYKNYLAPLLKEGVIEKFGKPPKVYYSILKSTKNGPPVMADKLSLRQLNTVQDFLQITPLGQLIVGEEAFKFWCDTRGLNQKEYIKKYQKLQSANVKFKDNSGMIDANNKIRDTFRDDYQLEKTVYLDFYADEIFGKTALGQLVLYSKQSQNKKLFNRVLNIIKPKVDEFIAINKIEATCFIPPSIKRDIQFMGLLEKNLALSLPRIKLSKLKMDIITPQKTLTKLKDRIDNANRTILVDESKKIHFERVLIIDDAVGSGASLNETARLLKMSQKANQLYGLAIVGSKKGFDVISEV